MHRITLRRHWNAAAWYLFIGLLAIFLVRVFLSHWSLLDGSARNGLGAYLQGQAERPFAYRWLAPWAVQHLSGLLPDGLRLFLANDLAPLFHQAFVAPLLERFEPLLPGITARAEADWAVQDYRVHYVLMSVLLWLSSVVALAAVGKISRHFGNTRTQIALLALTYAVVYPSVFLHAGYFYDVFEQAFALLAILCVLRKQWLAFALVLVVMQCNRETALLLPVFLAPLIRAQILHDPDKRRPLAWLAISMAACLAIDQATKSFFAGNAGASFEFHLWQNLAFWRDPGTWAATYDTYAMGIALPRLIFLLYFVPLCAFSVTGRPGPVTWSACLCLAVMSMLFITLGYRDEFRAVGICLPFVLAALSYRLAGSRSPAPQA